VQNRKLRETSNKPKKLPQILHFVMHIAIKWRNLRGIVSRTIETVGTGETA
jgi:hypothetical protein